MSCAPAVLVGIDGTDAAWDALAWAAAEAAAAAQPLCLAHVVRWPTGLDRSPPSLADDEPVLRAMSRRLLDEGVSRAHDVAPHLTVATELIAGTDVAESLLFLSQGVSLIVVGRRTDVRRHWWRRRADTGVRIARRSRCPVAVVALSDIARGPYAGRVVALHDGGPGDSTITSLAEQAAARRGAGLSVVHADVRNVSRFAGAALVMFNAGRVRASLATLAVPMVLVPVRQAQPREATEEPGR